MKSVTTKRTLIAIIAMIAGITLVYLLSLLGNQSKGPLESLFSKAGNAVEEVENNIILEQREESRTKKLAWFNNYRENKEAIIKANFVFLGASDNSSLESYERIINLEDTLGTSFPIIHIFQAWGERPEHEFPEREFNAIHKIGSIPFITWEPWVSAFSEENFPGIPAVELRDKAAMVFVAKGYYDSFLRKWAQKAKDFGHPFYLRLGHEMNDPYRYPWGPQNNTPQEYVKAWKHVHDLFLEMGAQNVIWVWSPHVAYGFFKEYYPGEKYVDVVATGALNFGTSAQWSKWWTFDELFGGYYSFLAQFKKPIMIAEFGSLSIGGSRSQWFTEALQSIEKKYPLINALVFFHYSDDKTTTDKSVSWYFIYDKPVTQAIKKELNAWSVDRKQPK